MAVAIKIQPAGGTDHHGAGDGDRNAFAATGTATTCDTGWDAPTDWSVARKEVGPPSPHGTVELRIPKLRTGSYFPSFLKPRRMAEKALTAVTPPVQTLKCSDRVGRGHRFQSGQEPLRLRFHTEPARYGGPGQDLRQSPEDAAACLPTTIRLSSVRSEATFGAPFRFENSCWAASHRGDALSCKRRPSSVSSMTR